MRYPKLLTGLAAAGLLIAGCGSDSGDESDKQNAAPAVSAPAEGASPSRSAGGNDSADTGQALAVPINGPQEGVVTRSGGDELKVLPEPERGAPFARKVEHSLREAVLSKVKTPGKTSATCPDGVTQKASATSLCVVTYEGAEVPFEVTISDRYTEGSIIVLYNSKPTKGLLVAKQVYHLLWDKYGPESGRSETSKLACDEIPVASTVELGADTQYKCQYWSPYGDGGKPGYKTLKVTMGASGTPSFQDVR